MSTSIDKHLSKYPLTPGDLEIALGVLFGRPDQVRELTREQKAEQEEKLRPYMVHARTRAVRAALRRSR